MKTFKFLSLSLLVATIGVCGFGNTVAASSIIQNSSINDAIKLKEKYDAFYKELTKQVVDKENLGEVKKNLREISEESNVPFDVLKSILLTNPTYKQIDDVYQRMQPQNRTYSAVTKKMIEQTNEELYYGRVEYYFKVLGYNTTDVSNEEIVEYIN